MNNITRFLTLAIGLGLIITTVSCVPNVTKTIEKAKIYKDFGQYPAAIAELKKAIDVSPENSVAQYWMGFCYDKQNEVEKSLYHYELAVKHNPAMELAQMAFVDALNRDRQVENSLETLNLYLKYRQAASRDFQRLAENFLSRNMLLHAEMAITAALRVEPNNPRPLIAMVIYFEARGDDDNVKKYLRQLWAGNMNLTFEQKGALAKKAARYGLTISFERAPAPVKMPRKKPSPLERKLDSLN